MIDEKKIDWEQRRYEIVRDLYRDYPQCDVIRCADTIVKELKKSGNRL